jgi:polyphenol oxidase
VDGVLEATLDAMEALGATRARTRAVIGPTISQKAYEVGPEFFDRFRDEDPDSTRFFVNGPTAGCCSTCPATACTGCVLPG